MEVNSVVASALRDVSVAGCYDGKRCHVTDEVSSCMKVPLLTDSFIG